MPLPSLVQLANTFGQWVNATNNLISHVDNTSVYIIVSQNATPRVSTGNVSINGTATIATVNITSALTANSSNGTSGQILTSNGTGAYWAPAPASVNTTGGTGSIQFYNGTTIGSSANLVFNGTSIFVGNSTSNGNYGQTTLAVSNTTNTTTITPVGVTIGTTVVNTTVASFGGTLSVAGAANALGTLGVDGLLSIKETSELVTINTTSLTGIIRFDILTSGVVYYSVNATANWSINAVGNATTTLSSLLPVGRSVTLTTITTQNSTPRYPTAFYIDGVSATVKWQSGITPSAGTVNGTDVYTYTVTKLTAGPTYLVLGTAAAFA